MPRESLDTSENLRKEAPGQGGLDEIRSEVRACLARGSLSARELATMLRVSERTAVGYVALLAADGEPCIERVALRPDDQDAVSQKPQRRQRGIPSVSQTTR